MSNVIKTKFYIWNSYNFHASFSPDLGWRDVQHMVARTSSKGALRESGWKKNGAGLEYNSKFGFGVMNADRLVKLAKKVTQKVGEQKIDEIK